MPVVQIPNIGRVQFPDDLSQDELTDHVQQAVAHFNSGIVAGRPHVKPDAITQSPSPLPSQYPTLYEQELMAQGPGANRYSYNNEFRGELASPDWDVVRATHGDPILAVPLAIGAKMLGSKDPENAPFKPIVNLPKFGPQEIAVLPDWAKAPAKVVTRINERLEGFLTPEQITQMPALGAKGVQMIYLTQMAADTPELVSSLRTAKTEDERLNAATDLGLHLGMAGLMLKGLTAGEAAKLPEKIPAEWREVQEPATVRPTGREAAAPVESPKTPPPASQVEVPIAPPGANGDVKGGGATRENEETAKTAEPETATAIDPGVIRTVEFPVAQLKLSADVPNFKSGASEETGTVSGQELQGKYERTWTAPVVAWERLNGDTEIITGRHRFELARRTGEKTIPTQIVREADGFTKDMALTFDAEANIRDGQGEVSDYATYFKGTEISEDEARARGLLSRVKGKAGWSLAKAASDDVYSLWQADKLTDPQAIAIANAAPGDASAQQIGSKFALQGKSPEFLSNVIKAARSAAGQRGQNLDLFGADDSAMKTMAEQADRAAAFQREIAEQIRAVQGAAKRPEVARALGVDVKDPEAIVKKIEELKAEQIRWQDWPLQPDLVARVKGEKPVLELAPPESVEEQKARLSAEEQQRADQAAKDKLAEQAAKPLVGSRGDIGQGDFLGGGDLLSGGRVEGMGARPAVDFESAETGKPFQMRLLRGQGRPDSPYSEFVPQEPILGKGLWTTPSREYAETFGKNITEHDVDLRKPLVIRTDEQWRNLIKEAGWQYANPFGQDIATTQKNIRDIRSLIESKGHDGVVIDPSRNGDEAKVLWDVFGERQAVDFKPQKSGRVEGMGARPRPETPADREQRQVRTQIRATEQAGEPGLAAAGKELGGQRVEGMGGSASGRSRPSGATSGGPPVSALSRAAGLLNSPDPQSPGRAMQLIIRAYLGKEYGQVRSLDRAYQTFKKYFDKSPKPRDYVYQAGDELAGKMPKGWQVQWAIDSGNAGSLTPAEQNFARAYRATMDWAVGVVQEVSPDSLRDLYQNYFGRLWKDPEKNANAVRQWINSRPLEGSKSFLKERVLKDWIDGIKMGLEPVSDNPVDMMLYKAGEMIQFAGARMMKQEAKTLGLRKFFYLGEKVPEGWRVDPDPKGEVFAPPLVKIEEAYDAQVRAKTLEMFQKLGIPQQRLAKMRAWGLAYEQGQHVKTKFGGADFVFWHEFGHIMDFRYSDLRQTLGLTGKGTGKDVLNTELRALADARGARQSYARKAEEKMANVFDAYIRAPDLFRQTAPTVWTQLHKWLDLHPEVKGPINEIRPSLKLGGGTMDLKLAGPVLLGHWAMPEQAVRVMENFQGQSLLSNRKVIPGLRAVNGLLTSARLFGFFHGGMVTNDSFYGGLSLILNDALRGKFSPTEAAKNLLMVPRAFRLGGAVKRGIEGTQYRPATLFTAEVNAVNKEFGKYALEANLRSHIGTYDMTMGRRWQRAANELLSAPSVGAAWETFWRAPFAAMAATMHPVMDGLVPRMKYGMNGLQIMRILQDGPTPRELTADELFERNVQPADKAALRAANQMELQQRLEFRDKLAKSADSVEDRIGQVTYDNLFLNKTLKDASTLGLTAFGWHLTKYRGVLGGTLDWARAAKAVATGQKPEVTFRMTYLPAMVMGHAIIGGILQYVLTGKRPQSAQDLLFPDSGLVDAYGKPIRLAIADYVKDIAGDINAFRFHGIHGELDRQVGRLAPLWNMAAEMYRNKDFWGNQIFSQSMPDEPEMEHLLKNLGEGAKYLAGSSAPFTARTGGKLQEAGANKLISYAAPFVGVVPASADATMTPAEALAYEISAGRAPAAGRTPDQAKKAQAVGQLVKDVRTGKINNEGDFEARERAAGVSTKQQETAIQQRVRWSPLQRQVWLMPLDDAMRVWDLASDQQKLQLVKFRPGSGEGLAEKVFKASQSGRLDGASAQRYVALLLPYWQRAVQAEAPTAKANVPGQRQPFRATTPP